MATIVASSNDDFNTVYKRITEAIGDTTVLNPFYIKVNSINIIGDSNGVLRLVYSDSTKCWYVQHLWGDKATWISLLKAANTELISRGEGAVPVRWRDPPNPQLNTFLKKLKIRTVIDGDIKKSINEITPVEAVSILTTM